MGREELLALAERVEAASGPDCELDLAIFRRLQPKMGGAMHRPPFPYTASLDAAMTLVPDGFDWILGHTNGGLTIHAEVGGRGEEYMRFATSPALALTAAALRAMAQEQS